MQLPKNWNDITLYQYQELIKTTDEFDSLSILLNTTPDDPIIEELSLEEVIEIFNKLRWVQSVPLAVHKPIIEDLHFKSLNKLTLGEYIDLDYYAKDNIENLHKIMAILYRKIAITKWGKIEIEPYDYDLDERAEIFLDVSITNCIDILRKFNEWKITFLNSYKELFTTHEEMEDDEELTGRDKIIAKKEAAIEAARNKWSWESLVWNLSNKDITKFEEVFNTPIILVFNTLSMNKVLGD